MNMRKLFYVSVLVMIVMAIPCMVSAYGNSSTTPPPPSAGSIQGIVSDASTGNPIAGATVGVAGITPDWGGGNWIHTETDSTGYYILNGVAAGSTVIVAGSQGYELSSQNVQVIANDTVEADISLVPFSISTTPPPPPPPPAQGAISGTVTDASTGNPIAGASVSVTSNGGMQTNAGWGWAKTSTDANGNYLLTGISAGSTFVYAQAHGYYAGYQGVDVIASSTVVANLSLTAKVQPAQGSVQGTVSDASTGLPIAGAYVYAQPSSQQGWGGPQAGPDCNGGNGSGQGQFAQTDSTGSYILTLIAGNYNIIASANGYQSQSQPATVTGNSTTEVDFALQSIVTTTGSISGTVSDASTGNPIVGANVIVAIGAANWFGNLCYLQAQTDSTGTYELGGVPSGNQAVKAWASGYEYSVQTIAVVASETVTANFALNQAPPPPQGTITGTVSDASTGLPLVGAKVFVKSDFGWRWFGGQDGDAFAITDANGNYSIYSVSTGTVNVIGVDSGYYASAQQATVLDGLTTVVNISLTAYGQGSSNNWVQVQEKDMENTGIASIPMSHFIAFVPVNKEALLVSRELF